MADLICPFSAPQIKRDYDCIQASEIVRRGGSEIACGDPNAHNRCVELHEKIKLSCLEAMNLEDDLLSVPHSTWVKIQYGGLLAIHNLISGSEDKTAQIHNISALLDQLGNKYSNFDDLPFDAIQKTVIEFKPKRRSSNR